MIENEKIRKKTMDDQVTVNRKQLLTILIQLEQIQKEIKELKNQRR